MIVYTKTSEQLPCYKPLEQLKVLVYSKGWVCPIYGMYTCLGEYGEWAEYDQQEDRYYDMEPAEYWAEVTLPS